MAVEMQEMQELAQQLFKLAETRIQEIEEEMRSAIAHVREQETWTDERFDFAWALGERFTYGGQEANYYSERGDRVRLYVSHDLFDHSIKDVRPEAVSVVIDVDVAPEYLVETFVPGYEVMHGLMCDLQELMHEVDEAADQD
jgi:hypothetical protein